MSGQRVNFHFLKTLFDIEYPMSESLRAACRLQRYHIIYPTNFQKMTVSTAFQVNVIFNKKSIQIHKNTTTNLKILKPHRNSCKHAMTGLIR